jgi:hypothetical protein
MRNISFNVLSNSIESDDNGSNEKIVISFIGISLNSTIVKLNRGAYIENILLDDSSLTINDKINIAPYFYVNGVKILTDKNYTYTTKDGSSGGGGDTINNVYVDNEDVENQLGVVEEKLDTMDEKLDTIEETDTTIKSMVQSSISSNQGMFDQLVTYVNKTPDIYTNTQNVPTIYKQVNDVNTEGTLANSAYWGLIRTLEVRTQVQDTTTDGTLANMVKQILNIVKNWNWQVEDCSQMFYNSPGLQLNYENMKIHITNPTNTYAMFAGFSYDIGDMCYMDISNNTSMQNMFSGVTNANYIDISSWTSWEKVTTASRMFYNCKTNLILPSKINAPLLTSIDYMFYQLNAQYICSDDIDINGNGIIFAKPFNFSNLYAPNLSAANNMFQNAQIYNYYDAITKTSKIYLPYVIMSNVEAGDTLVDCTSMFYPASYSILLLNISNNKIKCGIMRHMFRGGVYFFDETTKTSSYVFDFDKMGFDTSQATNMNYTFYTNTLVTSIKGLNVSACTEMTDIFYNCTNLTELELKGSLNVSLDLSTTGLLRDGLVNMINGMDATTISNITITIGSTKLALLSDDDIALFTTKNYTLA